MTPSGHQDNVSDLLPSPITILVGHFGSGKTEIGVNLAFQLHSRRNGSAPGAAPDSRAEAVTLVDLDVVKPYFRSRGMLEDLEAAGIDVVAPRDEFAQADLPMVVREVRAAVGQATDGLRRVIMDVGGADVGARVLGSIPGLTDPSKADVLFVVNGNRPFAETSEAVLSMLREIERVSRLQVHGLIANTHLMDETTVDIVCEGIALSRAVGQAAGVPVRFCAVRASLAGAVASRVADVPLLAIERHIMRPLELRRTGGRRRSSIL